MVCIDFETLYNLTINNCTADDLIGIEALETQCEINIYEKIDDMTNLKEALTTQNEQLFMETVNTILCLCFEDEMIQVSKSVTNEDETIYYDELHYLIFGESFVETLDAASFAIEIKNL
jgi:hypothetical protein